MFHHHSSNYTGSNSFHFNKHIVLSFHKTTTTFQYLSFLLSSIRFHSLSYTIMDSEEDQIRPIWSSSVPPYGSIDSMVIDPYDRPGPHSTQKPNDPVSAISRPPWASPNASGDLSAMVLHRDSFDTRHLPTQSPPNSSSAISIPSRQGSFGPYSRLRRRSALKDTSADYRGDYIIHDLVNANTRSRVLEREHQREMIGKSAQFTYVSRVYFVLIIMGIGAGLIAAGLDLCVEWLSDVKFGICTRGWFLTREMCCKLDEEGANCPYREWSTILSISFLQTIPPPVRQFTGFLFIAVLFATTSAFLVKKFAPHAAGSGVPEIKAVLSGVVIRGYLSSMAFVVKIIGLALSVASGLNLGKEGPFVHLVSVLANMLAIQFEEFRENHSLMLEFITVGTAAGVSVAFNAPIGGVLFAFEEAASYFPNRVLWRSFLSSAIAELTLKLMNPFFNGKAVMFEITHTLKWYWFEMFAFFFIGIVGGILGCIFIHYNVKWSKLRIHDPVLARSPIFEVVGIMITTVILQYPIPFLRLTNNEVLSTLFSECSETGTLLEAGESLLCDSNRVGKLFMVLFYAVIAKLFLTILTFGARIPAGLFIPSMTIGACAGRIIGVGMQILTEKFPDWLIFRECSATSVCVRPSLYALVGAGSTLAGVTQVSVSLVVIMFELTGGLSHLLPTMFGILAAKMVCTISGLEGIYDMHINIKRYPFLDSKHHVSHADPARVIMRPPRVIIPETGLTLGFLRQLLHDHSYYGFPIVRKESDMILTGNIVREELAYAISKALEDPRVSNESLVSLKGEFDQSDRQLHVQRLMGAGNEIILNFALFRDRFICQVAPETPISEVYDCFSSLGIRMVFVTRHGELLGLISKKDIIAYCDAAEDVPRKFFR